MAPRYGGTLGLDIVELVLAVEEEFDVQLPDERLNRIRTVGELHNLVAETLSVTDEEVRAGLWSRLLDVIEKEHRCRPKSTRRAGALRRRSRTRLGALLDLPSNVSLNLKSFQNGVRRD
jgi:hypothetical protein